MKKKRVIAIIEAKKEGYIIYSDSLPGISGYGETIEDAKRNIKDKITYILKRNAQKRTRSSRMINNGLLTWIYRYDVESLLSHFPAIEQTNFVRNLKLYPSLMYQHKTGITLATEKQIQKIAASLHALGRELLRVQI